MNAHVQALYDAAAKADDDYQKGLVRVYGRRRAADMRYRKQHTDRALIKLKACKVAADNAFLQAVQDMRAAGK